jgi:hypothetical protein
MNPSITLSLAYACGQNAHLRKLCDVIKALAGPTNCRAYVPQTSAKLPRLWSIAVDRSSRLKDYRHASSRSCPYGNRPAFTVGLGNLPKYSATAYSTPVQNPHCEHQSPQHARMRCFFVIASRVGFLKYVNCYERRENFMDVKKRYRRW